MIVSSIGGFIIVLLVYTIVRKLIGYISGIETGILHGFDTTLVYMCLHCNLGLCMV